MTNVLMKVQNVTLYKVGSVNMENCQFIRNCPLYVNEGTTHNFIRLYTCIYMREFMKDMLTFRV